jgi:FimV-like protein
MLLEKLPLATDGELFIHNMESVLDRHWFIYRAHPERPGLLEALVDGESMRAQFFGDYSSLDRICTLANTIIETKPDAASSQLIAAQVNSARHLFKEAQHNLDQAKKLGADDRAISRIQLSIDQALGHNLEEVLASRLQISEDSNAIEDLIPLGALLVDLGRYDEANEVYLNALRSYDDLSPLGLAWACFQLGFLWGEVAEDPDLIKAEYWYSKAVSYLPGYAHATVHLAEIYLENGDYDRARALLNSIINGGDPEARWRMSELLAKEGDIQGSACELEAASAMYEDLLSRHELAFADHAAEFYLGSGNNPDRALKLALLNLRNRGTIRAYELAIEAAEVAEDIALFKNLSSELAQKWGSS